MDERLIRDVLGSPVPQHFNEEWGMFTVNTLDGSTVTNGDIDFSRTKLLRDRLGSVIPQVWDSVNQKWVVVTTQNADCGSGEGSIVTWDKIQGKPPTFPPSAHTHEINEINGLQERLDEIMNLLQDGGEVMENNTWLEELKVDNINLLSLDNFDITNLKPEDRISYGDGSNKWAVKPVNPALLSITQKPATITIKLKAEYKDVNKYVNVYNSKGHVIGTYYDDQFDANGQVVLTEENAGQLLLSDTIFIDLIFETEDGTEMRNYWVDIARL